MAAHRYWRLLVTAAQSGAYCALCELELCDAYGSDYTTPGGGSPTAQSSYPGLTPANAFDNSNSTNWANNGTLPGTAAWLEYDFGAGNEKDVGLISITARADNSWTTQSPKDFKLQYSDDNASWTDSFSITGEIGWGAGEQRYFPHGPIGNAAPGAHRYWRILTTSSVAGNGVQIAEVEMRTSHLGADVTGSGTASAVNTNFGYSPAYAFDNILTQTSNGWRMNESTNNWLKYDFGLGNAYEITEIAITGSYLIGESPKNFKVQYSDDNANWSTAMYAAGIVDWSPGQRRLFNYTGEISDPGNSVACRYWRLVTYAVQSGSTTVMHLAEMEMRLYHGGADQTGGGTAYDGIAASAGQPFSQMFDNNAASYWGGVVTSKMWGGYDFGAGVLKAVNEISLTATSVPGDTPTEFYVQRSDDSISWSTNIHLSGITGWVAGQTRYFDANGETTGSPDPRLPTSCVIC